MLRQVHSPKTIEALKKVRKAKQDQEKKPTKAQESTKPTESPEVHAWSRMLPRIVVVTVVKGAAAVVVGLVSCLERLSCSLFGLRLVMVAYAQLSYEPTLVGAEKRQPLPITQLHRPPHGRSFLLCVSVSQRSVASAAININSRPSQPSVAEGSNLKPTTP
jgi:hypothetical protein